jgi:hypothetical protein
MPLSESLAKFGTIPFSHGALLPLLADYRRPNDKIAHMLAAGELLQLRRGLYVLGAVYRQAPLSLPLVANHLRGPSCVSLDFALSWHGLIPESVIEISSVTPGRSKTYHTALGRFTYTHVPLSLYRLGINMQQNPDGSHFVMAGPEKALCDKLALTRNLQLTSITAMQTFLLENLRIDEAALQTMNSKILLACAQCGYKQQLLSLLQTTVEAMQ